MSLAPLPLAFSNRIPGPRRTETSVYQAYRPSWFVVVVRMMNRAVGLLGTYFCYVEGIMGMCELFGDGVRYHGVL